MLLAHGAGSGPDQSGLVAIADALAPWPVQRMTFPYRAAGRRAPDRAPVLMASLRGESAHFAASIGEAPSALVLGGRSMGGRIASMVVAEGDVARALVLIAYPLHPPGKPDRLRTEHLPQLQLPCLFVSGTRDPFGTPEELRAALELVPGPVTLELLDGVGHELKGRDVEVAETVLRWLRAQRLVG
jgi:predicted alpha/beta-hydrolase family hydrolase